MKNKGLIITMIVLLSIIVVALIVFLCFAISGNFSFGSRNRELIFDNTYKTEGIELIEISSEASNIIFEEGTDNQIRVVVYGDNRDTLNVESTGIKIKIDHKVKSASFFGGINSTSGEIKVYLPKDYENDIRAEANYGNIEMCDLENASIDIESDCGNVELGRVKNVKIDNSLGNTKIENVLNKLEIESDCGDVKIEELNLQEDSKIVNSLGNVKIGKTNEIYIDAKIDLGNININTNSRDASVVLKIESDCGDIKVDN